MGKVLGQPLTTLTIYGEQCVLLDGTTYKMWYLRSDSTIGYSNSTDGINWRDYGQVLGKGPGEWESKSVRDPWVIFNGTHYLMWYQGYVDYPNGDGFSQIGFAWSRDGISWTKYGTPVLARGSGGWDTYGVLDPTVILEGSTYKMASTKASTMNKATQ